MQIQYITAVNMKYLDGICKKLSHLKREASDSSFALVRARQLDFLYNSSESKIWFYTVVFL